MRITHRDVKLVKDIGLSHLLSRDQIIALGYFKTVTRANTRLRELASFNLVKRLDTPFFSQSLYSVGCKATDIVGERVGALVRARTGSPRFIQHALSVTNVRIALLRKGNRVWKFEQQAHEVFGHGGRQREVRPDGIVMSGPNMLVVEVDLGHVAPNLFKQKLEAYDAFVVTGNCERLWNVSTFQLLTVTTSPTRIKSLYPLVPRDCSFAFNCMTFEELNVPTIGAWS